MVKKSNVVEANGSKLGTKECLMIQRETQNNKDKNTQHPAKHTL